MKKVLVIVILLLTMSLYAEVFLNHTPPVEVNRDSTTRLELNIIATESEIREVILNYRKIGEITYREEVKRGSDITSDVVSFQLPQISEPATGYEYYFTLISDTGRQTLPQNRPGANPHKIFLPSAGVRAVTSSFTLLTSEMNIAMNQDLVFAVSFFDIEEKLNIESIRVLMNGRDITNRATITPPLLVYTVSKPAETNYSFQITARRSDGSSIESPVWNYNVRGKPSFIETLPFNVRGNAVFSSNMRNLSQDDDAGYNGVTGDDASLRLNLIAARDWFSFRSRLYLSSYESSSKQPVNRYSLGFSVPHLDIDLIDSSPDYGTFLVSNKNIRGISGRMHFGTLNILSTYGESIRAIDGKAISDTLYTGGTFQRQTLGAKIELGADEGMRLGFGIAKNKDRIASLDELYYLRKIVSETDTTYSELTTPKDNFVFGADMRISLDNQRFVAGAEIAASIYNSNILDGALSKDELEDYLDEEIPFDPKKFENIIIINKNIEPIIPNKANLAYQIYLRWFLLNNFLNFSYSEVGASFNSLSAGYLQTDSRILNLSDNISLLRNQLLIDAGFNLISDNLSGQKDRTTTNLNFYFQTMIRPRNLPYFRVTYNTNTTEDDQEVKDLEQKMDSMSFGVGYTFTQLPQTITTVDLSYTLSNDEDLVENPNFDINRDNIQFSINNRLREIPLNTRFSFSNSSNKDNLSPDAEKRTYTQWGIKNEYTLLQGMLTPYLDLRFNSFGGDQASQMISTYEFGTSYRPFRNTGINTSLEFMNYNNKDLDNADYTLVNWRLQISQRF